MEDQALEQAVDVAALLLAAAVGVLIGLAVGAIIVVAVRIVLRRHPHVRRIMRRCRKPLATALAVIGARTALQVTYPVLDGATRPGWLPLVEHGLLLAFIAALVWLVVAVIGTAERIAIEHYGEDVERGSRARRVQTQAQLLGRVAVAAVIVVGVSAMLLTFPGARTVGASLLASAGIVSVVVGLAAQSTLGNLLAGLQIAFTDSIRIDDVVVVENKQGNVEEITLTYVVVKIWDERRMILPSKYFTDTPFENLTRSNAGMLGSIELDLDWSVPVSALRQEVERLVRGHELWDGRTASVAVTEAMAGVVRVRVLLSAADTGKLFDLRSYVRECLVDWIQREAPYAVPVQREVHLEPTAAGGFPAVAGQGERVDEVAEELADELEELAKLDDALSATDTFDSAVAAVRARSAETRPGDTAQVRARAARRQAAKADRRRAKLRPGALGLADAEVWMVEPSTDATRVLSAADVARAGALGGGAGGASGGGAGGEAGPVPDAGADSIPGASATSDPTVAPGTPSRRSVRDRLAAIGARARTGTADERATGRDGGGPARRPAAPPAAGHGTGATPSATAAAADPDDPHGPRASATFTGSPEAAERGEALTGPGEDVVAQRAARTARLAAEARGETSPEPDPLAHDGTPAHDGDHDR